MAPSVAEYLRKVAARGENPLFGFGPEADFKDSAMNMAYAMQGGTNLPDKTYYFDADKKAIREAYVKHIAKVLELSGVPAADAATQASEVMAFETRLARVSQLAGRDVARRVAVLQPGDAGRRRQADAELPVDHVLRLAGRARRRRSSRWPCRPSTRK